MKLKICATLGMFLFLTGPVHAAPASQLECAYDQINAKTMMAVIKLMQAKTPEQEKANEAKIDRVVTPIIDGCAKQYSWTDEEAKIATIHYSFIATERLIGGLMNYHKIDTVAMNAMYKEEPLTRDEMIERFENDDKAYTDEWIQKIIERKIGANTEEKAGIALGYLKMRMAEEELADDFQAGILSDQFAREIRETGD